MLLLLSLHINSIVNRQVNLNSSIKCKEEIISFLNDMKVEFDINNIFLVSNLTNNQTLDGKSTEGIFQLREAIYDRAERANLTLAEKVRTLFSNISVGFFR